MSQIIDFRQNQKANKERKEAKLRMPSRDKTKAHVSALISSATTLPELKDALILLFNGNDKTPGVIDAITRKNIK